MFVCSALYIHSAQRGKKKGEKKRREGEGFWPKEDPICQASYADRGEGEGKRKKGGKRDIRGHLCTPCAFPFPDQQPFPEKRKRREKREKGKEIKGGGLIA